MKVLICGVAGFIASHLAERLLAMGVKVLGCDNFSTGNIKNLKNIIEHPNFLFEKQDICKWEGPSCDVDIVYQFACPASPPKYMSMPIDTYLVNSIGNYNMLQYAKKSNARFVFASTSEIYGEPLVHPQKESYYGNVNSIGPRSCYDEGKRFGEGMSILYNKEFGLDVRVARIFNVYGPRMDINDCRVIPNFVTQSLKGETITIYGDGEQTRSFCYIDDFIDAIVIFGCKDGLAGSVLNIGNPEEITINRLMLTIQQLCNTNSTIEFLDLPTNDPLCRRPDISKAKQLLNWEPKITLTEGLGKCINYYKEII